MKLPTKKVSIRSLKQEIITKAQKSSELSRKIRHAKSTTEARQFSEELKRIVNEMEPVVATLATYRRQQQIPKQPTKIETLKREIRAKARRSSELSQQLRQAKNAVEINRLSRELKQLTDEMAPLVATLAAYQQQKAIGVAGKP